VTELGDFGDRVARLHVQLAALGLPLPESELERSYFGPGTRDAVRELQAREGLELTGVLDAATSALLTPASSLEAGARAIDRAEEPAAEPIGAETAADEREVPVSDGERVVAAAPSGAPLGDLLGTMPAPLSPQRRAAVEEVVADSGSDDRELMSELRDVGLSADEAASVGRTLGLAELAGHHVPLVAQLQEVAATDPDASLRGLSRLRADEWLDLVYASGPPQLGLDAAAYAERLQAQVEEMHPTATLAERLQDGSPLLDLPGMAEVRDYLREHPDGDLIDTPIPELAARLEREGVGDADPLVSAAHRLQRVKGIGATWDEAAALLDAGLDSAFSVTGRSPANLRAVLGGAVRPERIDAIRGRARAVHDTSVALMVSALPRFAPTAVPALAPLTVKPATLAHHPTLQGLFGALETCECRHCRSVLSPAAYLVDLLELVRNDDAAFAALASRRPDLLDLELSCANTEQELPAIDLALEILENAVGLPLTVDFPPGADIDAELAASELSAPILDVLRQTAVEVPTGLKAHKEPIQLEESTQWTVADARRRWSLRHHDEALLVTQPDAPDRIETGALPLDGFDVAALVADLDAERVPATLEPRLRRLLLGVDVRRPKESAMRRLEPAVTVLEAGRKWRVTYELDLKAHVDEEGAGATLELATVEGDVLVRRAYSRPALAATVGALEAGVPGGMLAALVPEGEIEVVSTGSAREWMLKRPKVEAELTYVPHSLTVGALTYQSADGDADVGTTSQNRNPAAYQRARDAVFPWSLPFDLPLAETRLLLARAGTTRERLMELRSPATRLEDQALALEHLRLTPAQADLITTAAAEPEIWRIWGLSVDGGRASVYDASAGERVAGAPLAVLSRVSVVLQQARLSYDELLDALQCRFVQGPGGEISITPPDECRPSRMRLAFRGSADLDRLHRFVRLRRASPTCDG
jgi:hypothetical protein